MPRKGNTRLIIPMGPSNTVVRTPGSESRKSSSFVSRFVSVHSAVKRIIMLYLYGGEAVISAWLNISRRVNGKSLIAILSTVW